VNLLRLQRLHNEKKVMRISVVVPTYNRREHVLRAIDSVIAQTRPVSEIIVVDDGSTDGTAEAIESRFGQMVKVYRQENGGVSSARNCAIRKATGDWIAFLDSDDVWFPMKIELQVEALGMFGPEFGVCFTNNIFAGNPEMTGSVFDKSNFRSQPGPGILEEPTRRLLEGREPFFTSSLLVLRSLLEALDGFDERLIVGEDADIAFRLSFQTKFCFVAESLVAVDRTPSRDGLCNLYMTRDDRKYQSFERRYNKWLAMPEVAGTEYEQQILRILREFRYDSVEAKIHQLRIRAALNDIVKLRATGESYISVLFTLTGRKLAKMSRKHVADNMLSRRSQLEN
jgi:glycosyltransferase involved in cell wall biosynthesis